MMAQSDASRNRTTYDAALRQLAEIELQARLVRERSELLVADAKRIIAAVRETNSNRRNRSASTFDAPLAHRRADALHRTAAAEPAGETPAPDEEEEAAEQKPDPSR